MVNEVTYAQLDNHQDYTLRMEFIQAVLAGPTYVRLEGSARHGTIGMVQFLPYKAGLITEAEFNKRKAAELADGPDIIPTYQKSYDEYMRVRNSAFDDFKLLMDDGKIITPKRISIYTKAPTTFTWLRGYEGPTVAVMAKVAKADKLAKVADIDFLDQFKTPVKVGAFVTIGVKNMHTLGTVTKISETKKTVYVTTVHGDKVSTNIGFDVIVLDDNTKKRAMMVKLTKGA